MHIYADTFLMVLITFIYLQCSSVADWKRQIYINSLLEVKHIDLLRLAKYEYGSRILRLFVCGGGVGGEFRKQNENIVGFFYRGASKLDTKE